MNILQIMSNGLTTLFIRGILYFMNTKTITPEIWEDFSEKMELARQARDDKIRDMRKKDPAYWTYERLAKEWKMSKQNIDYILNGDPRPKKRKDIE